MAEEDRQTEMALLPPRVEDQEADQRRRSQLTLEDVPGFDRPVSSGPDDKPVGQDELGRTVYETITGQRYTVDLNPDQRTGRQRFEEDVLPAMQEYLEDPTLPTAEQVGDFAVETARGVYRQIDEAVSGEGTLGTTIGLVPQVAAASATQRVPEGAVRIFGGFSKATDPGRQADRQRLPISIGADGQRRFEIDDSTASFLPFNLKYMDVKSEWDDLDLGLLEDMSPDSKPFSNLNEVIDHPELFRQYPELEDIRIVVDTSIGERTNGYFDADKNLIAVSRSVAEDPENFASVLLHEIQHGVQRQEGFDTGTAPESSLVSQRAAPALEQQREYQRLAAENLSRYDFEPKMDEMVSFLDDLTAELQASNRPTTAVENVRKFLSVRKSDLLEDPDNLANRISATASMRLFFDYFNVAQPRMSENLRQKFSDSFNVRVADVESQPGGSLDRFLEDNEAIPINPTRFNQVMATIRDNTYLSRSGEVESRNVQRRKDLSLQERFDLAPYSTEPLPRMNQWRVDEDGNIVDVGRIEEPGGALATAIGNYLARRRSSGNRQFNEGGLAMEEQMKLFEEGGLSDDGMNRDPISGNEVPSGSMAEEVRDDIPAQLSEGEYVVPADVVRYYGVKFFEDLRADAKMGLNQMERNGRIGGEPVDAPMGEAELSPEEMQMLQELTGMAEGGYVDMQYSAPVAASRNPTNPDTQMYDPMAMQGMYNRPRGFSNGGMPGVADVTQEDFMQMAQEASQYQIPGSIFTPPAGMQETETSRTVTLYGPNNEEIVLILPADQTTYDSLLSQGYTTEMKDLAPATTQQETDFEGGTDFDPAEFDGDILSEEDVAAMTENPLAFGTEALDGGFLTGRTGAGVGALIGGPGMMIGGLAGTAMELNNIAKARASLRVAASQGLEDTAEYAELEESINNAVSNLNPLGSFLNRLGVGSGNRIFEQVINTEQEAAPAAIGTGGGRRRTTRIVSPVESAAIEAGRKAPEDRDVPSTQGVMDAINRMKDNDSDGLSAFEQAEKTRQAAAEKVAEAEGNKTPTGTRRTTEFGKETYASKVQRGGGFKKGGLVDKPKTKKAKK